MCLGIVGAGKLGTTIARTAIEAGYSELTFEGLLGFFGPRGIATELRDRISADVRAVAAEPTDLAAVARHLGRLMPASR